MSVWKYENLSRLVRPEFQLTQGEGNTAIEEVVLKPEGINEILIYLKREDTNPNGSFKDRSLAFQVSYYRQKGMNELVISSSGNAAISAASYCKQAGIDLHIFVSEELSDSKMKRLQLIMENGDLNVSNSNESMITLHKSKKAKSDAIKFSKENGLVNLRGSADDFAIEGFKTLGYEIGKVSDLVGSVFIPCSSGTSTIGIFEGLKDSVRMTSALPAINIVQTTKIHPMAGLYDKDFGEETESAADAITDRVANRSQAVVKAIDETGGFGWVVSTEQLSEAKELLKKEGLEFSNAATLSIAGIIKAARAGKLNKSPLAIISGL